LYSFWNGVHMRPSIFVHETDWKQNEAAPDSFKFEEFSAALSKKCASKRWKNGKIKTKADVSLKGKKPKCEVYLMFYQMFHFHWTLLPGKSLMM